MKFLDVKEEKQRIRERIWKLMEEKGISTFPNPFGRIPNFIGAEKATEKLRELKVWKEAKVISVSPDSPQRKVRELVLKENKVLIMPTPKLREGFLILENLKGFEEKASTIKGAFKFGKKISAKELPNVNLIIVGSVAVTLDGIRLGKAGGYSDLEYVIMRKLKKVEESTPVITTVHEIQIVKELPREKNDVPVDFIVTPERVIATHTKYEKPNRIYWELISEEKLKELPLLKELKG